jgi:5'-3' exonuclease
MTTLLIDGDEYLFRACVANELDIRWDDHNHVLQANREACWDDFAGSIDKLAQKFNTQDIKLCFSGTYETPNFRLAIDPAYKASRQEKRKPLCYADLRSEADATYNTQAFPGLEADDVMGILATKPGADCIIVSQDKDMKTLPAKIWTGSEMLTITADEADYWHMFQTLTGDTVDGFKGCPGMGPVGAQKLLGEAMATEEGMWPYVVKAFEKKQQTEADALRNARLARILRWGDWDKKKKEPILWRPQTAT